MFGGSPRRAYGSRKPKPDFTQLHEELQRHPHLTLQLVWEEYRQADVVSLHARLTSQNRGLIGEQQLRMMKPSAYLINTARGALVDHQALYRALKEGWISGAALDIYDTEPIDLNHPLLELNNVTLTPHIAGSSKETALRSAELLAQEVTRFVKNQPLLNLVNPTLEELRQ